MIIGVKYWNHGGTVPGSWTNLQVAEVEFDFDRVIYDSVETLDKTVREYGINRYFIRIVIDPVSFNNGTYGPVALALRKANFARVNSSLYTELGTSNTINFVVPASRAQRLEPSIYARTVTLEMRAEVPFT